MALLGRYYAWASPTYIREHLTIPDIIEYHSHIPTLAYRENYQLAQLEATLLNMFGGKGDGTGKPLPPERAYTPDERIAVWARLPERQAGSLTRAAARELLRMAHALPAWALQCAPLAEARAILEG